MVLLLLAFLLVVTFLISEKIFLYSLMVFFVLFDMLDGFYEDQQVFNVMRYIVPLMLLAFLIVRRSVLKRTDWLLILLCLYMLILLVYSSSDIVVSARNLFAVVITFLMIPVGRYWGKRHDLVAEFEGYNRFLLIILPCYIILANIFKFGESYSEAFTTGFLVTSRMYIVPIVLFLAIHYIVVNKKQRSWIKGLDVGLIVVNIGILIVNTRRTTLGMLAAALFIYAMLNPRIIPKMAMLGFLFIAALIFSYPLYEEQLTAQLEKRERIQDLNTYEEEGRYLEGFYIMDYHNHRQNIKEVLFGVKLFDTEEFGSKYFGRNRPIHSDINMIFFSTGLLGIILFFGFYYKCFFYGNSKISRSHRKIYYPILIMFLIVLLPGRFIGTLTYAPFLMYFLSAIKAWRPESEPNITGTEDNDLIAVMNQR